MSRNKTVLTERAGWLHRWDGQSLETARCNSCGHVLGVSDSPLILSFINGLAVLEHEKCPYARADGLKLVRGGR